MSASKRQFLIFRYFLQIESRLSVIRRNSEKFTKIISISNIQIFQKSVPQAKAGENVGALLKGVKINAVRRGMWVCHRNSQNFSNHYEAQLYLLNASEGGRKRPIAVSFSYFHISIF